MRVSFRPPSVPAIWKTDLEWGSRERKDLHVLTKHKHAVVSISFPGNEQIPEPVGMCNQEFVLKLPGVQPWGVKADIFPLNFLISQYTAVVRTLYFSFFAVLWSAWEFLHVCYTFAFFVVHCVVGSFRQKFYQLVSAVRFLVSITIETSVTCHSQVQPLVVARAVFSLACALWAFHVTWRRVMMSNCSREHQKLMSLTALSAMTLPFTDKSVSDLLKWLPDAFNIWTMSSSQASHFALVMFV